jgi:thioredoxin
MSFVSVPFLAATLLLITTPPRSLAEKAGSGDGAAMPIAEVSGLEEFNRIVEKAGDRLLVFDLYADWCVPCKYLTPMLEEVAKEHGDIASFYKIDVDDNPAIAAAFGVSGIPYVVFVKEKKGIHAITGLRPKAAYVRAVKELASGAASSAAPLPDGEIVDGVRVIELNALTNPDQIIVHRGETVKLLIDSLAYTYSIHIPRFDASARGRKHERLEVTFKATEVGVFPMYCNGDCPAGDGAQMARIVVMRYTGEGESRFEELSTAKGAKLIADSDPLVLDVRTPREYYGGHLEGATLIPLQQLAGRLSEIASHKKKPILLYCRSGNRSTVAAEILARDGFTKLYHLHDGIRGWKEAGMKVVDGR